MIDMTKKYLTPDGREVRIYATDGGDDFPVHGAIKDLHEPVWRSHCWNSDGFSVYSEFKIIEVKPRIKQLVWINVYPDNCFFVYQEKRKADIQAMGYRIACVQVELDFSEGDGL